MKVRIGVSLGPAGTPAGFAAAVDLLEQARIDSLWLPENVYSPVVEPFTGMAFALSRTSRLKVGTGRRFSATTEKSLVADLRTVLAPQCLTRARELATRMTKPADSVATAADLVEDFARLKRVG